MGFGSEKVVDSLTVLPSYRQRNTSKDFAKELDTRTDIFLADVNANETYSGGVSTLIIDRLEGVLPSNVGKHYIKIDKPIRITNNVTKAGTADVFAQIVYTDKDYTQLLIHIDDSNPTNKGMKIMTLTLSGKEIKSIAYATTKSHIGMEIERLGLTNTTALRNLNADKLDGKHLNEDGVPYLRGFKADGRVHKLPDTTSFDSINYNSVYNIDSRHPDILTVFNGHSWAFLETLTYQNSLGWRTQTLKGMNSGYEKTLIRILDNGTWGNWVEQTSEDNILDHIKAVDGSGSGIDADKLDGLQGSSYARANGSTSKTFNVAKATSDNHAVRRAEIRNIPHSIGIGTGVGGILASRGLAIGDGDTGFHQVSNGILDFYANNHKVARMQSSGFDFAEQPKHNGSNLLSSSDITGNTPLTNLNADKLDGKHLNEDGVPYLRGFMANGLSKKLSQTTDLDTINYNSIYTVHRETDKTKADATHRPVSDDYGYLHTIMYENSGHGVQIWYGLFHNECYRRTKNAVNGVSTWQDWIRVTDENCLLNQIKAVDGSGSGIDADKLDGLQGSSYARANGSTSKTFYVASATHDNHAVKKGQLTGSTPLTNLNADKLDGKHLNEDGVPYLRGFKTDGRLALKPSNLTFTSSNYNATYSVNKTYGGLPSDLENLSDAIVETAVHDNGDITQTLKGTSKGYETIFIRNKENGSWSGWVEQTSEDNILDHIKAVDGSGSGIDADKLDGKHLNEEGVPFLRGIKNNGGVAVIPHTVDINLIEGCRFFALDGSHPQNPYPNYCVIQQFDHGNRLQIAYRTEGRISETKHRRRLSAVWGDWVEQLSENNLRGFKADGKLKEYTATDLTNIDYNSDYFTEHNRTDTPHNSTFFLKARIHPTGYYKTYELNSSRADNTASFVKGEINGVKGEWQVKNF